MTMFRAISKRQIFSLLLGTAVLVLFLAFSACSRVTWRYYIDSQLNFSIKYPVDWDLKSNLLQNSVSFIAPRQDDRDEFLENVSITVRPLPDPNQTLLNYSQSVIRHTKAILPMLKIYETTEARFGRYPGYRFVYEIEEPPLVFHFLQMWTIHEGRVYMFAYTAEKKSLEEYQEIIDGMIKSFELKKP